MMAPEMTHRSGEAFRRRIEQFLAERIFQPLEMTDTTFRPTSEQLARLERWISAEPKPRPTRPEAIRRLMELGLQAAKARRKAAER